MLLRTCLAVAAIIATVSATSAPPRVVVEPYGPNALRVRATAAGASFNDAIPSALPRRSPLPPVAPIGPMRSGNLVAEMAPDTGLLTFTRASDGAVVLRELGRMAPDANATHPTAPASVRFAAEASDAVYGLGQGMPLVPYPTWRPGPLDRKGVNVSFMDCAANEGGGGNCLPWHVLAGRGATGASEIRVGFLWNVPSFGGVHFAANATDWWSHMAYQLDYLVVVAGANDTATSGPQAINSIQETYTGLVGRTPPLPSSLLGYWHSKNCYDSQAAVLTAMAGFRQRNIPVDVFIIDICGSRGAGWPQGNFALDPAKFPDPSAMTAELARSNTRVMVSVWAGTDGNSSSHATLVKNKWVVRNKLEDEWTPLPWPIGCNGPTCFLYDASNADARRYVWERVKAGYVAHNITLFWLDASEPQPPVVGIPVNEQYRAGAYAAGDLHAVGMAFPNWHTRTFSDGFAEAGLTESVTLARSSWFGASAHRSALWSGDTYSSWLNLRASVTVGLGAQLSGIAWWTTDVGGYRLWNISHMPEPELVVRWFQFGLTCPLLRQHGHRPETVPWAYGPEAETIIADVIRQRAAWQPYLRAQHDLLAARGTPFNRPLWWDFPSDATAWAANTSDTYMVGREYLAAPVLDNHARTRDVYLPGDPATTWWAYHYHPGAVVPGGNGTYPGGQWYHFDAPLNEFPLFKRIPAPS